MAALVRDGEALMPFTTPFERSDLKAHPKKSGPRTIPSLIGRRAGGARGGRLRMRGWEKGSKRSGCNGDFTFPLADGRIRLALSRCAPARLPPPERVFIFNSLLSTEYASHFTRP